MERTLPAADVKARIGALAVGLASDCDAPESDVAAILHANLPGATGLPFVAFLTADGAWVAGYSGSKDVTAFVKFLADAEASPARDATPAVRKQLDKVAKAATAAAAKGDWKPVLAAGREAAKTTGRCPERDAIRAAEKLAAEWLAAQWNEIAADARSGADLAPARRRLAEIKKHFAGQPAAAEAETGVKALLRLTRIREAEAASGPSPTGRRRAAEEFAGSRWADLFATNDAETDAK